MTVWSSIWKFQSGNYFRNSNCLFTICHFALAGSRLYSGAIRIDRGWSFVCLWVCVCVARKRIRHKNILISMENWIFSSTRNIIRQNHFRSHLFCISDRIIIDGFRCTSIKGTCVMFLKSLPSNRTEPRWIFHVDPTMSNWIELKMNKLFTVCCVSHDRCVVVVVVGNENDLGNNGKSWQAETVYTVHVQYIVEVLCGLFSMSTSIHSPSMCAWPWKKLK